MSRRCGCTTFRRTSKGEPQVVYTHPIGIGKVGWSTPEGVTHVVSAREGSGLATLGGAAHAIT